MSRIIDTEHTQATIDTEHRIQTGLVKALCEAAEQGREPAQVEAILTQLVAYSEAHFMSEELLMRLESYDEYDDHVADHGHMMDELDRIAALHRAGQAGSMVERARAVLEFIERHIATRDQRFAHWQGA